MRSYNSFLTANNASQIVSIYRDYIKNPSNIDQSWHDFFKSLFSQLISQKIKHPFFGNSDKKFFSKSNSLPVDEFFLKVLYDKNLGYYQNKNPFGIKGDYITAPHISKVFCEMIAIWVVSFWENLKKPVNLNFIELGPGNGDFCLVLLRTLKNFPEAYNSIKIKLYEKESILEIGGSSKDFEISKF